MRCGATRSGRRPAPPRRLDPLRPAATRCARRARDPARRRRRPGAPPPMARRHLRHRLLAQRADRESSRPWCRGRGSTCCSTTAPSRPTRGSAATPSPALSRRHSPPHLRVRATAPPARTPTRPSHRPVGSHSPRPHPPGLTKARSRCLLPRPRPAQCCRRRSPHRSPSAPLVGRAAAPGLGGGRPCLLDLRRPIAPPRNDPGPRRRAPHPHPPRTTHGVPRTSEPAAR